MLALLLTPNAGDRIPAKSPAATLSPSNTLCRLIPTKANFSFCRIMEFDIRKSRTNIRQKEKLAFMVGLHWIHCFLPVAMGYYSFEIRFPEGFQNVYKYKDELPLELAAILNSYDYGVVSEDRISIGMCGRYFEDRCRRYLYGMAPIKMGFKENKELHMIRTEKKVQILRLLYNTYLIHGFDGRVDHIVEKIDFKKFVSIFRADMAESLEHRDQLLEDFMSELIMQLQEEIEVRETFECECYMIENQEIFYSASAAVEKFYFFLNASLERIVCLKYLLRRTELSGPSSSDNEGNETEDETAEEGGDAPSSNSEGGEDAGDEESEIGDETEEERVDYPTTDLEGHGPENCLSDILCVIQVKAVITFLHAILDKTFTVALLDDHGRGKPAPLGLAIAGAVAAWYCNIYITAPSAENLKTLFDFVCEDSAELEYKEHLDSGIVKSNDPEFKKSTMRINIYKQHGQTNQYILLLEHAKLSQVELLVVDEAAAIPLPVVKSLLGPYLVFLASTMNSYEGAGRSLSLKLLQQLEEQSQKFKSADNALSGLLFKERELSVSIRYASGDRIEWWLNALLCLDVTYTIPSIRRLSQPGDCDLFNVNWDTLFSYHKDSEVFLQRMMVLYVASRSKDSSNYLQLMAVAPAYHLFVLLGPVDESEDHLDILCFIQVCLEDQISRESAKRALWEGRQPFGDQIPWKFSQQFADDVFPSLSGARTVRIGTNPSAMRMGYVSAVVELLPGYFEGQLTQLYEVETEDALETPQVNVTEAVEECL